MLSKNRSRLLFIGLALLMVGVGLYGVAKWRQYRLLAEIVSAKDWPRDPQAPSLPRQYFDNFSVVVPNGWLLKVSAAGTYGFELKGTMEGEREKARVLITCYPPGHMLLVGRSPEEYWELTRSKEAHVISQGVVSVAGFPVEEYVRFHKAKQIREFHAMTDTVFLVVWCSAPHAAFSKFEKDFAVFLDTLELKPVLR